MYIVGIGRSMHRIAEYIPIYEDATSEVARNNKSPMCSRRRYLRCCLLCECVCVKNRRARNAENENISRISALLLVEALDTNVRTVEERKGRKKVGREMVSWAVRLCEKVRTCDVCCEMRKNLRSVYCMYLLFGLGLG